MIKAINTNYAGHLFRSRLEARWAVYFDELGFSWEYEKEGFDLGEGLFYLPDFYSPKYNLFLEVKSEEFTKLENDKCLRLAKLTNKKVAKLVGLPSLNPVEVIIPYKNNNCIKCGESDLSECNCNDVFIENYAIEIIDAILLLNSPKESYVPLYFCTYMDDYSNNPIIHKAIHKAKCARFEHGESGSYPKI